ncbi:MAG: transglycosylase domain-containing protein [bacterium]
MGSKKRRRLRKNHILVFSAIILFIFGAFALWIASLRIPALEDISERKAVQSTKIYDRTGEILLYDTAKDVRRELIPFENISAYAISATIAIEDRDFYNHNGFRFSSFIRATLINLISLSFNQGGSTITQQVVKNSILTKDKTPTRKLKELILALKLEKILTKNEILTLYLNEIPYGGNVYGIEEAAQNFFNKNAGELTLLESAYLAALPKAPTYYSPYGTHRENLEKRKNLVLEEMLSNHFITQEEFDVSMEETVTFKSRENLASLKAPHFVFFVLDYLANKYGDASIEDKGFRVITTLDYNIEKAAEEVANQYGHSNEENFNGKNAAIVVIDPKTGEILAMVGSRDYFDTEIDGNFNVALAHRQPGSAFKPFVYATLFNKGYTPETILFDVPTQFSTRCPIDNLENKDNCYAPVNYDDNYRGPMTVRNALAQSVNIPAVKALYLAGIKESIITARAMGINSLEGSDRYGLTLVLGGGEVSLLDMTSAYAVFANDGLRNPYTPILRVEEPSGEAIEAHVPYPIRVLSAETSRKITNILSDQVARAPLYGPGSVVNISGREVALKTGTTNDYRDAWIIGYTPNIVVGTWAGNNDNSPMVKKVSGLVVAPIWRALMDKILPTLPIESFPTIEPPETNLKPVLSGVSLGNHSILYWVDKNNPKGPTPNHPENDSQFKYWEYGVTRWLGTLPI